MGIGGWGRALLTRLSLKQLLMLAAAAVVLLSGVFGGLERATPKKSDIAELSFGDTRSVTPIEVTITGVRRLEKIDDTVRFDTMSSFLVVDATIRGITDDSLDGFDAARTLNLEGVRGARTLGYPNESGRSEDADPTLLVRRDLTELDPVVPGLEFEVMFVWGFEPGQTVPSEVTLATRVLTWRQANIGSGFLWADPKVEARGTFDVAGVSTP